MKVKEIALDGLIRQNPTFKLVLGTCPTLALTTLAFNGIGMGLAVTFVLICSNVLVSLLRNTIPDKVRIPAFVLIIASFVTIVSMVLEKYMPDLYQTMGVYLPLIVVNCIILARAESFASHNKVGYAALDGLFMGLGFTVALTLMGIVREILGKGSFFGLHLWNFKIEFFASSPGAFLTYALFIMVFSMVYSSIERKNKHKRTLKSLASDESLNQGAAISQVTGEAK
jgi:electron transport complex protein RnfE